jgi:ribosomal-protein-alanine N-acetyltransferase
MIMIRSVDERDLISITRIWKENIETNNTFLDIAFAFSMNKRYWFVSVEDKRIVGFVAGTVKNRARGHVSGIAVIEGYRRKGIGKRLIETVENAFVLDSFQKVTLEVRKNNFGAQKFYERQGYAKTYTTRGYYPDGEDAINYEKTMTPVSSPRT